MILFMMTFLFVYSSYRYYKDIEELNRHLEEREAYISMIEAENEFYEHKYGMFLNEEGKCNYCEENNGMGAK